MFVRMGCKRWTRGRQLGLRIYTPSIHKLAHILNLPSRDNEWDSLDDFLNSLGEKDVPPYSRDVLIIEKEGEQDYISATVTIAKHGHTSQGYITASQGTWLAEFVETNLDKDFSFEYQAAENKDLLIVPDPAKDLVAERKSEYRSIRRKVKSLNRRHQYVAPPNAQEIGVYFETKEAELLESQGFRPSLRYPYVTSRISWLRQYDISCDIDVLDSDDNFVKYVEVKAVAGAPGTSFNLTRKEWDSREKCRRNGISYKIVIYYHAGKNVLERRVIPESETLVAEPSGYWCTPA